MTFLDEVENNPEKLVELHKIESYKFYMQGDGIYESSDKGCCTIF